MQNSASFKFWLRSVTFLDYVLSDKGLKVYPKKTKVVLRSGQNLLQPKIIAASWDWMVIIARFVEGFYSIAAPLTALTKKKVYFEWVETCENIFQELKDRFTTAPMLTFSKCGEN